MIALFLGTSLFSQDHTLKVANLALNDTSQTVDLSILATTDGVTVPIRRKELEVEEKIQNGPWNKISIQDLVRVNTFKKQTADLERFTVMIMVDQSSDLSSGAFRKGKELIEQIIQETRFSNDSEYFISGFAAQVDRPEAFDPLNISSTLADIKQLDGYSDLNKALFDNLRWLKRKDGKKLVILVTDGNSKIKQSPQYDLQIPYEDYDVLNMVRNMDPNIALFPIGVGNDINNGYLEDLSSASPNRQDGYAANSIPEGISALLTGFEELASNYLLSVYTDEVCFRGEKRAYRVNWKYVGELTEYEAPALGSANSEICLIPPESPFRWLEQFLIGMVLVFGTLGAMSVTVPYFNRRNFMRRFVSHYRKDPRVNEKDPVTGDLLEEGQLVVHKCKQKMLLSTWDGMGQACINYPKCMDWRDKCDGAGKPMGDERFFSMKGSFRALNWLWFGMLGGFIAWILFAVFKFLDFEWYENLIAQIYNTRATEVIDSASAQVTQLAKTLSDETLLGIAFGTGISFTLSWMEERTQPRKLSWGRIIVRTLIGLIISLIVFTIGFNLQYIGILPNVFLSGLLTWILFGIGIGFVMSVNSSISFSRALLGGVIASVVGFCVYMLISNISLNFGLAKLISFILVGGILGYILNSVVSSLEDFELEYISPVEFRGTNRISKWLNAGLEIFIGRQPGSTVYVKWEDEHVAPQHAKLSFVSGVVYIEALEETLVHNKMLPIGKKVALQDGDMIQLGRYSNTRMKYVERRKS